MEIQTDAQRADYWKMRALSEQARGEEAEAEVLYLRKRMEAAQTRSRIAEHAASLKANGLDLSVGVWNPDDERECFVRAEAQPPQT